MEEINEELPNFTIHFEDDLAVLQASKTIKIAMKAKAMNPVMRTLGSISNKRCFHTSWYCYVAKNCFMVLVVY